MDGGVLKVHHPCLLTCDGDYRACGDFRLGDGPFCLFRFADIFVVPAGAFSVLPPGGRHHNNSSGLSSSFGKCKIGVRTIDIEWRSVTRRACLRPCKQPEGAVGRKYGVGASGCLRQLLHKARRCHFGLFHLHAHKARRSPARTQAQPSIGTRWKYLSTNSSN